MTRSLRSEIKQTRPWRSVHEEAALNLARTAAVLGHAMADAFKPYGITPTQYNVLRILRGAGAQGLCRNEVRDRLIAQVPDVTRLLDRMEEAGLIDRARDASDRRMVATRITPAGLRLLDELDEPVRREHERRLGHLSRSELRELIRLLTRVREGS